MILSTNESGKLGNGRMDSQATLDQMAQDAVRTLWVIYHDYSGRACAKAVPAERFSSVLHSGIVFANANLDFTVQDLMAPDAAFRADSGDFLAVPDPASYTVVPYHTHTARMHAFMRADDGSAWAGCPRTALQRVIDAYAVHGLTVQAAFEPEFILFRKVGDGEYATADQDGMFTVDGLDRHYGLWQSILDYLETMGVHVTQHGKEGGPGQYEAGVLHAAPMRAVDDYLTFKEVVRSQARRAGYVASFMPKPYAHLLGCGLHMHLSLWDAAGEQELGVPGAPGELLSPLGRQFVAGLLAHASALTGVGAPTVNSYKRLLPGSWAPAHVAWGLGNRAALVRVPGRGQRRHIEYRAGDNSANAAMYLTALLAAGLDGITRALEAPPPIVEDVGHGDPAELAARGVHFLPRTLTEALAALEADSVIGSALGPIILSEFLKVKRAEQAAYEQIVHPWERQTYLEVL